MVKVSFSKSWPISLDWVSTPLLNSSRVEENILFEFEKKKKKKKKKKKRRKEMTQFAFQDHAHIYTWETGTIVKWIYFHVFVHFEVHRYTGGVFNLFIQGLKLKCQSSKHST